MPVRLPAKVARPPVAVSWPALSAVMVSAVVAPSPMPATTRAAPARAGRGAGDRRPCGTARPFGASRSRSRYASVWRQSAAHVFT